jgi:hypothetical protein
MAGLNGAIAGSFSSEDIGDLERGAQVGSAAGTLVLHQQRQMLEGTGHRADRLGRDARVECGRIELAVPQQDLDDADIDILFQQMGRKADLGRFSAAVRSVAPPSKFELQSLQPTSRFIFQDGHGGPDNIAEPTGLVTVQPWYCRPTAKVGSHPTYISLGRCGVD